MQYIITDKNLWLKILLEEPERIGLAKALEEATENIAVLEERFVQLMGMEIVSPEENGDLTDGAIVTDGRYEWWDNNYQVRSFLNILADSGEYSLMWVRSHDMPLTRDEQIDFLSQLCVTENILNLPLMYSINITDLGFEVWSNVDTEAYENLFSDLQDSGLGYHVYNPEKLLTPIEFVDLGATTFFDIVVENDVRKVSPKLKDVSDEVLKLQIENVYPLFSKAINILKKYKDNLQEEVFQD